MKEQPIHPIDILIVGSGPSGCSTALHLYQTDPKWADRIAIIDKAIHPREKLCGGGITHLGRHLLEELNLEISVPQMKVREAKLTYQELSYSFKANPAFIVVQRAEFDHWLVQECRQRGISIYEETPLLSIERTADYMIVTTPEIIFHAQIVVAADGSNSIIRRKLKWDDDSRVARLVEILTPENPDSTPEFETETAVFDFTPMNQSLQGYYWDFPSFVNGQPFMNRGLFDSRIQPDYPKADLKTTLATELDKRARSLDDYPLKGHPIRYFSAQNRFSQPRVLLVGDAAGVDPLMGEGISFALIYGKIAAPFLIKAFTTNDFSLTKYRQHLLKQSLIRHLWLRTKLARLAYWIRSPRIFRIGWKAANWLIKLTPWRNREYIP